MTARALLLGATLLLPVSARTQEPSLRERFDDAVATFQKSASDDHARKLADLAKRLDPLPATPEDAEFHNLKGAAFVKLAKSVADFERAAKEFQSASALAPWRSEYHYNQAVCLRSAEQYGRALTAVRFAQILARDDGERREALALRAEVEAAQERAGAQTAAIADRSPKREEELKFEGTWHRVVQNSRGDKATLTLSIAHPAEDVWRIASEGHIRDVRNVHFVGGELRFTFTTALAGVALGFTGKAVVAENGRALSVAVAPLPLTPEQEREWTSWNGKAPIRPWTDVYRRDH
jgi:tetratricopeptide (TPR) repeat protein